MCCHLSRTYFFLCLLSPKWFFPTIRFFGRRFEHNRLHTSHCPSNEMRSARSASAPSRRKLGSSRSAGPRTSASFRIRGGNPRNDTRKSASIDSLAHTTSQRTARRVCPLDLQRIGNVAGKLVRQPWIVKKAARAACATQQPPSGFSASANTLPVQQSCFACSAAIRASGAATPAMPSRLPVYGRVLPSRRRARCASTS